MQKLTMVVAAAALTIGALGCGHETRTVVRRETTQTIPAEPAVIERRTVIEPVPVVPEKRVYQEHESRTVIEE